MPEIIGPNNDPELELAVLNLETFVVDEEANKNISTIGNVYQNLIGNPDDGFAVFNFNQGQATGWAIEVRYPLSIFGINLVINAVNGEADTFRVGVYDVDRTSADLPPTNLIGTSQFTLSTRATGQGGITRYIAQNNIQLPANPYRLFILNQDVIADDFEYLRMARSSLIVPNNNRTRPDICRIIRNDGENFDFFPQTFDVGYTITYPIENLIPIQFEATLFRQGQ